MPAVDKYFKHNQNWVLTAELYGPNLKNKCLSVPHGLALRRMKIKFTDKSYG